MRLTRKTIALTLAAVAFALWHPGIIAAQEKPANDDALSAAICPIVYPVDQIPVERGYHYLFYGDGFFINEQGYLLTAAHVLSQLHRNGNRKIIRRTCVQIMFLPCHVDFTTRTEPTFQVWRT